MQFLHYYFRGLDKLGTAHSLFFQSNTVDSSSKKPFSQRLKDKIHVPFKSKSSGENGIPQEPNKNYEHTDGGNPSPAVSISSCYTLSHKAKNLLTFTSKEDSNQPANLHS